MAISNFLFIFNSRAFPFGPMGILNRNRTPVPREWLQTTVNQPLEQGSSLSFLTFPLLEEALKGHTLGSREEQITLWIAQEKTKHLTASCPSRDFSGRETSSTQFMTPSFEPIQTKPVWSQMSPDIPPPPLLLKTSTLSSFVIQISFGLTHYWKQLSTSYSQWLSNRDYRYTEVIMYQVQDLGSHIVSNVKKWVTRQLRVA